MAEAPLISKKITDDRGKEITLENSVKHIISIAPNITEIIFTLGGEQKLIARSQACNYPDEVFYVEEITTSPQLDLEQLKALESDLILTTDEVFTSDDVTLLEKMDINVYLQSYHTLDDIYRGIRGIGEILELDSKAKNIADSLQLLETKIVAETEKKAKYATMILISIDPLVVIGGTGFLNELIQKAGGKNAFADKNEEYYTTSVEEIIQRQPEYIILPTQNEQIYGQLLALHPTLQNTPADLNKQVFIVPPDLFYRPGPRMLQGLLQLANILHSDLQPEKFLNEISDTSKE